MKKQQHQPSLKNKRLKYSNQTNTNYEKIVNKKLNLKKKLTQTRPDIPEVGLRPCGRLDNLVYPRSACSIEAAEDEGSSDSGLVWRLASISLGQAGASPPPLSSLISEGLSGEARGTLLAFSASKIGLEVDLLALG